MDGSGRSIKLIRKNYSSN